MNIKPHKVLDWTKIKPSTVFNITQKHIRYFLEVRNDYYYFILDWNTVAYYDRIGVIVLNSRVQ